MAFLTRTTAGLGLLVGTAFALAAGCGSSDDKKVVARSDGGEAGVPNGGVGAAAGGQGGLGQSGSLAAAGADAGASTATDGGAGGVPSSGGGGAGATQSQAGETGLGGVPAVDCTPSGQTVGLSLNEARTFDVCRGGVALVDFSLDTSDQQFTCCGTSSAGYGFEARGVADNDGGGTFTYLVHGNVPLGAQTLDVTCESGLLGTHLSINVNDTTVPVLDAVTTPAIAPNGNVTIVGSNLAGVNRMAIIPVDPTGEQYYCNVNAPTHTDTEMTCKLSGGAPAGDYTVSVFAGNCGAVNAPTFSVIEG